MFICEEDGMTDGCSTKYHKHLSKFFAHNFTINRVLICVSFPEISKYFGKQFWRNCYPFYVRFCIFETKNWPLLAMCAFLLHNLHILWYLLRQPRC